MRHPSNSEANLSAEDAVSVVKKLGYGARAVRRCLDMRRPPFSESAELLSRPYLSAAHAAALTQLESDMHAAGMTTRRDAMGTLIGRYEGETENVAALAIGSHVDSVRDGGAFDGMLGVQLGLACVEALAYSNSRMAFAIEVFGFGDEEGSRFPSAMNASRALIGALPGDALDAQDSGGVTIRHALDRFGVEGASASAARAKNQIFAFIEPHIEQGPQLEAAGRALGAVHAIAGQIRAAVKVAGKAGHAGTSPMGQRQDAVAAAAEMILAIEHIATEGPGDLVATVGRISAAPGAANVIPGQAEFSIDVRAGKDFVRDSAFESISEALENIATARGIGVAIEIRHVLPATALDAKLTQQTYDACKIEMGAEPLNMVSGAGHDAMIVAAVFPTTMLFIRCAGGLSHHPDESVSEEDGEAALSALIRFLFAFDKDFQS